MTGLPWYRCYPRDFNDGMTGLTMEERGAYVTVLNCIYARGGPVPDDATYFRALLSCAPRAWAKVRASLIAKGKLEVVENRGSASLMNRRASDEIAARTAISAAVAEGGSRGGRNTQAKARRNSDLEQAPLEAASSPPKAIRTEAEAEQKIGANAPVADGGDDAPSEAYPDLFEAAWKAYPHVRGRSSKPKALGFWRRLSASHRDQLPASAERYRREGREPRADCGAPGMHLWIRDQKFADWLSTSLPQSTPTSPVMLTPEVRAHRQRHFEDTGEWREAWGPRPIRETA